MNYQDIIDLKLNEEEFIEYGKTHELDYKQITKDIVKDLEIDVLNPQLSAAGKQILKNHLHMGQAVLKLEEENRE